jgi:streptogramin lyase
VRRHPLPPERAGANLNTATFDRQGRLWFTGQSGVDGRQRFRSFPLRSPGASVRQLLGRPGEVWGAESGADRLVVARTG